MKAIRWEQNKLFLLDQTRLPAEEIWLACDTANDVARAIVEMNVRGAPAIGASAAYGVALEAHQHRDQSLESFQQYLEGIITMLGQTRPTAVNLFWALERMKAIVHQDAANSNELADRIITEAEQIAKLDIETNRAIGEHGASLFHTKVSMLTHCNTGSLATVEYGTALGILRSLHNHGLLNHVFVDETRPYLQGARLTAFELQYEGIPHTLITDSMAAHFMKLGKVDAVVVGADRIAANGDTANKIGTYSLAVLCQYHRIPFYVAAPWSTFDMKTLTGADIPIEERNADEVTSLGGVRIAPNGTKAAHPAFDVTPHTLITGIVTECGVIHHPNEETVQAFWQGRGGVFA